MKRYMYKYERSRRQNYLVVCRWDFVDYKYHDTLRSLDAGGASTMPVAACSTGTHFLFHLRKVKS